jgi:hypothetical protein
MITTEAVISQLKTMADGSIRLQIDVIGGDYRTKVFCLDNVQKNVKIIIGEPETIDLLNELINETVHHGRKESRSDKGSIESGDS